MYRVLKNAKNVAASLAETRLVTDGDTSAHALAEFQSALAILTPRSFVERELFATLRQILPDNENTRTFITRQKSLHLALFNASMIPWAFKLPAGVNVYFDDSFLVTTQVINKQPQPHTNVRKQRRLPPTPALRAPINIDKMSETLDKLKSIESWADESEEV